MKKLAALFALTTVLGIAAPSFADDSEGGLDRATDGALIVTRAGGVGAGLVLGTPVAAARDSYHYYTNWTNSLADKVPGGHEFGPTVALVSIATLPASLFWGGVTGVYHGTRNALGKGFNEPFHPDSFSLGKDYEE